MVFRPQAVESQSSDHPNQQEWTISGVENSIKPILILSAYYIWLRRYISSTHVRDERPESPFGFTLSLDPSLTVLPP